MPRHVTYVQGGLVSKEDASTWTRRGKGSPGPLSLEDPVSPGQDIGGGAYKFAEVSHPQAQAANATMCTSA